MTVQIEVQPDTARMLQSAAQRLNLTVDAYLKRVANAFYTREALEQMAVQGYQAGELTEHQLQEMLGFDTRFEVHAFLKERGVAQGLSADEFEENRKKFAALLNQPAS